MSDNPWIMEIVVQCGECFSDYGVPSCRLNEIDAAVSAALRRHRAMKHTPPSTDGER